MIGWAADPNLYDYDRNTAMHFAVDYGYFEIVKALLASSETVDLNIRNNQNMTPFNTCRSPDIFEILLMYSKKTEKTLSKHS
jgi:ankyrin repeat protein